MRLFNSAVFFALRERRKIIDCQRYFYPLDAVGHWNRIYGRRGVLQYQLVLPPASARQGLLEILERTTSSGHGSFLAVLKSTGPANEAPLSFPIEGVSLALDFPNTGSDLLLLLRELDQIVLQHGGRVYLAKDSCLAAADFRAMYPRLQEFQAIKMRYDPETRFSSSLARRLEIVQTP
jgi:FAD/FMN-containing dehydrogenase